MEIAGATIHKLWSWMPMGGITLGKHIFVKDVNDMLLISHELVHVRQQREDGILFWLRYLLWLPLGWNKYRTEYEAQAYAIQASSGVPIDGKDGLAELLSSFSYGWCCRKAQASEAIKRYL